jgi:hypothetical protein
METPQQRQDLVADQAALRAGIARVDPECQPLGRAVGLRLGAPDGEERVDDAVGAARLDPCCTAA